MNIKKILGIVGIAICVLLLILATFRVIDLRVFWLGLILMAAFAYLLLPKIPE